MKDGQKRTNHRGVAILNHRVVVILTIFYLLAGRQLYAQLTIDTSTYLKQNAGIYSIIIAKNDQVLYRRYYNLYDENSLFNDQSLTKSIGSILIGIAIDKGYIRSVDEKLADFFPELRKDKDTRKGDITLRQLMCQASGLYHEDLNRLSEYLALPDPSGFVLSQPLATEPGKVFHYNNAATHLLSLILTKRSGMDTRSFAKKFLFDPLGISKFEWAKMRDGYYDGCGLLSIRMRSEDMTRIGLLLLNNGVYNGQQIVSSQWVTLLLHPDSSYNTEWGFDKSTYALCYYHTEYKGVAITYGMGWGGQFLILIPSLHAVVVANESIEDSHAIQQSNTFIHRIFPLIYDQLHSL
ncbi:MAG TPA: serine hydrolase [Puia sp.]|nr:serine hydrolase [Puia sp.]